MNKRDRVLNAMNLESVDHIPVGFWFHFQNDQGKGQACVQAHLDYYNVIDVDMVKIMSDSYFDYPNPLAKSASKPSDWYKMRPLGLDSPFISEQIERAKAVKAGLRDDMVVIYNVFAPFSYLRFGVGDELIMSHLQEDPEAILYALDVVAHDAALLSELLITQSGIDGIYYCVQGGEKSRFTTSEYRRLIGPSDEKVLNHANSFSKTNVLHCCGWSGIPNNMEVWQDYQAKTVNWACHIENMDLTAGKQFFNGRCVLGGFDNRPLSVLCSGNKKQVVEETRRLASIARKGLILGADCTLPASINKDQIRWVVETVKEMA